MEEATKLSLANAQVQLRRDVSEDNLAISAALTITRRLADHRLVYPALSEDVSNQVFAADLVAHLPTLLKAKLTAFDEAARMALPATESFEGRLSLSVQQPL